MFISQFYWLFLSVWGRIHSQTIKLIILSKCLQPLTSVTESNKLLSLKVYRISIILLMVGQIICVLSSFQQYFDYINTIVKGDNERLSPIE